MRGDRPARVFAQEGFRGRGRMRAGDCGHQGGLRRPLRVRAAALRQRRLPRASRGWAHDYPRADWHFQRILEELTFTRTYRDESNILTLDDPDLSLYPIAYMSEPGFWTLTEAEADGLRAYLQKGGFIIFDDFREARDWTTSRTQMRRRAARRALGAARRQPSGLPLVLRDQLAS